MGYLGVGWQEYGIIFSKLRKNFEAERQSRQFHNV